GFDDNDNAQVVLDGFLEQSCDRLIAAHWEFDARVRQIMVSARVLRDHTTLCSEERRPFTQVVDLGLLPTGKYRVWTNGGRLIATLAIAEATSAGADEESYAYLTDSYVEYDEAMPAGQGQWSVVLKGFFADHCQEWDY